jgi:hypothetical protein
LNTLSFGLLSLLNKNSRTGYELMRQIHLFWQVKHSQIYPLLASAAIKLIRERACFHQEKLDGLNQSLSKIKAESGLEAAELNLQSSYFGSYLIVQKAVMVHQANLEWCRWVESLLDIEPR